MHVLLKFNQSFSSLHKQKYAVIDNSTTLIRATVMRLSYGSCCMLHCTTTNVAYYCAPALSNPEIAIEEARVWNLGVLPSNTPRQRVAISPPGHQPLPLCCPSTLETHPAQHSCEGERISVSTSHQTYVCVFLFF